MSTLRKWEFRAFEGTLCMLKSPRMREGIGLKVKTVSLALWVGK